MKNEKTTAPVTLTVSEIEYIYTCWQQRYAKAYPKFTDYLKVAARGKEIKGSVYD